MSGSPFLTITNDQVFIQTEDNVILRVLKNTVESASSKDGKWEYYELDGKIGIYSVEKDLTWEFDVNEQPAVHKLEKPKVDEKEQSVMAYTLKDVVFFTFWGLVFGGMFMVIFLGSHGLLDVTKKSSGGGSGGGSPPGPAGICLGSNTPEKKRPDIPRYAGVLKASKVRFSQRTYLDTNADYILEVTAYCDIVVQKDSKLFHKIYHHEYGFFTQHCYLKFQIDGNLVFYRAHDDYPLWASGTQNQGYENMYYDVKNKSFKFF